MSDYGPRQIRKHVAGLMAETAIARGSDQLLEYAAALEDPSRHGGLVRMSLVRYVAMGFAARAAQDLYGSDPHGFARVKDAL